MSKSEVGVGKELYFDATQVNTNADLDSLAPRFVVDARDALEEHLAALFASGAAKSEESEGNGVNTRPETVEFPTPISQHRQKELTEENAARHDWIAEEDHQQREVFGSQPSNG